MCPNVTECGTQVQTQYKDMVSEMGDKTEDQKLRMTFQVEQI